MGNPSGQGDAASYSAVANRFAAAVSSIGRLDLMVHNAGIFTASARC